MTVDGAIPGRDQADIGIVVVAERPYAEGAGDSSTLALPSEDLALVAKMRPLVKKLVVVVLSGRPMILERRRAGGRDRGGLAPRNGGAPASRTSCSATSRSSATTPYTWPKTAGGCPADRQVRVRRRGLPGRLRPGRGRVSCAARRPARGPDGRSGAPPSRQAPPRASHAGLGYRPSVSDRHDPGPATPEPPAAPRPEDLIGRMIADRYRLDSVIGRGGMATIFRATDTRLGRPVALKLLRPEISADPDLADRFRREALAATVLRHGNIVPCLDTGSDPAGPFLVMELIDGEDLAARLRRTAPCRWPRSRGSGWTSRGPSGSRTSAGSSIAT